MKKIIAFIFVLMWVFGITGCASRSKSTYHITEVENVTISITDVSPIGAKVIIKDLTNTTDLYGDWYKIEKQIDGDWYDIEPVIEEYGFSYIGYLPDQNNEVIFDIDWEWLYGKLPAGKYRFLKEVGVLDNKKYIAVEFEIN